MRKKVILVTAYDDAVKEFRKATADYHTAQVNFSNAMPEYFEIANRELTIAQARVDMAMQKIRILTKE